MTFGEKLKNTRLSLNLSQSELAQITGISERSLYTYEQTGVLPRSGNIQKIAKALNVSATYLLDDKETDSKSNMGNELFIANVKNQYGSKGAREASDILTHAHALFAGGELNDEAKDLFFQSLMEIYLDSKQKAKEKFSSNKRVSRKKK